MDEPDERINDLSLLLKDNKIEEGRILLRQLSFDIKDVKDYFYYLYMSVFFAETYKNHQRLEKLFRIGVMTSPKFGSLVQKHRTSIDNDLSTTNKHYYPIYRNVAILCSGNGFPWDPSNTEKGINGSEEAVIYLANCMSQQLYRVVVFNSVSDNSPHTTSFSNPRYMNFNKCLGEGDTEKSFDIVIVWRFYDNLPLANKMTKNGGHVYFWPHDNICASQKIEDKLHLFHKYMFLSDIQRKNYCDICCKIREKPYLTVGNGINRKTDPVFSLTKRMKFVYASNYARGLTHALNLWPKIKERFPEATFDIYYGRQTWTTWPDYKVNELIIKIQSLRYLGVKEMGQVGHTELDKVFDEAQFLLYPCDFEETFCITAIKAQAKGCIVLTTPLAALSETVLTDTKYDLSVFYSNKILDEIDKIDKKLFCNGKLTTSGENYLSTYSKEIYSRWTWDIIANKIIKDHSDDHSKYFQNMVNIVES
jgi:hypothetical protein